MSTSSAPGCAIFSIFLPIGGDADGVGAAIVLGALALQVALGEKPGHEIGQRRTVDAGELHEFRLALAVIGVDREQHGELPVRETGLADLAHVDEARVLRRPFQQVGW